MGEANIRNEGPPDSITPGASLGRNSDLGKRYASTKYFVQEVQLVSCLIVIILQIQE